MKFTCERSILLKEISMAQEIVSSKNVISVLSYIYLEAENDVLIIRAKDLKVNFETKIPVMVAEKGSATILGGIFLGILGSVPEGEMEFEHKDNKLKIKTSARKANSQLKSIDSDKFKEIPVSDAEYFDIPIKDFKEMIDQTVFAISDDEDRYFLKGVYIEKNGTKLTMVSTDGRRLAFIEKDVGLKTDFPGIIVHPKILNIIAKRAGDEGLIAISITDKMIFVRFGSYSISSLLIEGQFPNYRKVIPEEQDKTLSINRLEMLEAIRYVSNLVEPKYKRIYLGLRPSVMDIYSEVEVGDAKIEIPCNYEGEEITLAFNYQYIEEPFKAIESDEVRILFTGPSKAITIKPVPDADFFHIVMTMQS